MLQRDEHGPEVAGQVADAFRVAGGIRRVERIRRPVLRDVEGQVAGP